MEDDITTALDDFTDDLAFQMEEWQKDKSEYGKHMAQIHYLMLAAVNKYREEKQL